MPNIKSQKDRVVQAKKEALHNKTIKSNLKTVVKKANAAIDSNAADKETVVKVAVSAIDSAKSKGEIYPSREPCCRHAAKTTPLDRGGIYAARSLPAGDDLPHTRGPPICDPYNSAAIKHRNHGARCGRDKSFPYFFVVILPAPSAVVSAA